jgi:glyoxylase-like metal-dependent hydrolase (beta-lactamase superfamily II)
VVVEEEVRMREIVSGILTWPWFSEAHGYNFNGYLVRDAAGALCIDPVEPPADILEAIAREQVGRILISNRNHVRAANRIRGRTGARTLIHRADADYARRQGAEIDGELRVGETIGPLVVLGVPGKSAGEVAFHWPEHRLLVVGDAVIGHPPGACSLLRERVMDDPTALRASVRHLLEIDFDCLLVGDGEPIVTGAKERLRELVASFPA